MKKYRLILSVVCAMVFLTSCTLNEIDAKEEIKGRTTDQANEKQPNLDLIRPIAYGVVDGLNLEPATYISIIGKDSKTEFWKEVEAGAKQAAADINKNLGYKGDDKVRLNYSAPGKANSIDEQINILDEELARYPAALGIAIADSEACVVQFDLALENGIPIVEFDSGSKYQEIASMCGTNNKAASDMIVANMGETMKEDGEVVLMVHDSKSSTGKEREEALRESLAVSYPDIKIVDTIHLDKLDEIKAVMIEERNAELKEDEPVATIASITDSAAIEYQLEKHTNVKNALGTNDEVTQILAEAYKDKEVAIYGFDGGTKQLESLKEGNINGVMIQNPYGMGYATVIAAARSVLAQGNEAVVDTGHVWVTRENMKEESIKGILY